MERDPKRRKRGTSTWLDLPFSLVQQVLRSHFELSLELVVRGAKKVPEGRPPFPYGAQAPFDPANAIVVNPFCPDKVISLKSFYCFHRDDQASRVILQLFFNVSITCGSKEGFQYLLRNLLPLNLRSVTIHREFFAFPPSWIELQGSRELVQLYGADFSNGIRATAFPNLKYLVFCVKRLEEEHINFLAPKSLSRLMIALSPERPLNPEVARGLGVVPVVPPQMLQNMISEVATFDLLERLEMPSLKRLCLICMDSRFLPFNAQLSGFQGLQRMALMRIALNARCTASLLQLPLIEEVELTACVLDHDVLLDVWSLPKLTVLNLRGCLSPLSAFRKIRFVGDRTMCSSSSDDPASRTVRIDPANFHLRELGLQKVRLQTENGPAKLPTILPFLARVLLLVPSVEYVDLTSCDLKDAFLGSLLQLLDELAGGAVASADNAPAAVRKGCCYVDVSKNEISAERLSTIATSLEKYSIVLVDVEEVPRPRISGKGM